MARTWNAYWATGGYGGMRAKTPAAGRFLQFFGKNSCFNAIWIALQVFIAILKNKIFKIGKPIEKIPFFTSSQVHNKFKIFAF